MSIRCSKPQQKLQYAIRHTHITSSSSTAAAATAGKRQRKCLAGIYKYIPVRRTAAYSSIMLIHQVQVPCVVKPLTRGAQQKNMKKNRGIYKKQKIRSIPGIKPTTLLHSQIIECELPCNHPLSSPHTAPNKRNTPTTPRLHRLSCTSIMIVEKNRRRNKKKETSQKYGSRTRITDDLFNGTAAQPFRPVFLHVKFIRLTYTCTYG